MGKLYEVLAVEQALEGTFKTRAARVEQAFTKRPDMFLGFMRRLEMINDDRAAEEELHREDKELEATVDARLDDVVPSAIRYFDAAYQKEAMNQKARANIVINEKIVAADVPVTFLLFLERRLEIIRKIFATIPCLDPSTKWVADDDRGEGIFRTSAEEITEKTEKAIVSKVLFDGNEHHAPQIEKWHEDRVVGKFRRVVWSGMYTEAMKALALERIDTLSSAVKKARSRANDIEVEAGAIGAKIMTFIRGF